MKKIYSTIILLVLSVSLLQAENPTWRCSKRAYRESACNYTQKCAKYCAQNKPLNCECEIGTNDTCFTMLWPVMWAYHQVANDEKVCKYNKKCYQYGYCPTCECNQSISDEMLLEVIDALVEEKNL